MCRVHVPHIGIIYIYIYYSMVSKNNKTFLINNCRLVFIRPQIGGRQYKYNLNVLKYCNFFQIKMIH